MLMICIWFAQIAVSTDTPIPFLALTTAITHLMTLTAALHHGRAFGTTSTAAATAAAAVTILVFFESTARVTRHAIFGTMVIVGNSRRPTQILLGFFLTQGGFARGCIFAKLGMQSHDIVAIFLTRRRAIMKVPALATTMFVRVLRSLNIGTSRCGAFGKVSPPLRRLIFRVSHESDAKEFALHRISCVTKNGGGFV
jgi:hypothetical protein